MALGQFGSLTYGKNDKQTYNFSLSGDYAITTLLTTLGKANFSTQVIGANQPQEKALENLAGEGHVEVLS